MLFMMLYQVCTCRSVAWTESLGFAVSKNHEANRGVTFVKTGCVIMSETNLARFFIICCVLLIFANKEKIASKLSYAVSN